MGEAELIQEVRCALVAQFLCVLRGSDAAWKGPIRSWLFRGQRDSGWGLVPSVFREDRIREWPELDTSATFEPTEFMRNELRLIRRFVKCADAVGLRIPGDCYRFRIRKHYSYGLAQWPPEEYMEIFAIAQHHGVPTRLLDFTHDGLVAAYFAAYDAVKDGDYDGDLAVWALDVGTYYSLRGDTQRCVQMVSVPTFDNNFLYSQKGLFLYDRSINDTWHEDKPPRELQRDIKETIVGEVEQDRARWSADPRPLIYKVSLPKHLSKPLLGELHREGVTCASVKPTYASVVQQMRLEDQLKLERM